MTLNFQRKIAESQAVLPVTGVLMLVCWFVFPPIHSLPNGMGLDYGLWSSLPSFLREGWGAFWFSFGCAGLAVYLLAELNNTNVLLRVSARTLSAAMALLLAVSVPCHQAQGPGCVLMVCSLLSFFPLFTTYQLASPMHTFVAYLLLSAASLVFPKLLWLVPIYLHIQGYFRALSFRCFLASIMATVLPYWFYGGVAVLTGTLDGFVSHVMTVVNVSGYEGLSLDGRDVLMFIFVVLTFILGSVDFYVNQYLDKTRVRIIYNALIIHGIALIVVILLQPQYFWTFLPILLVDTAVLFGHFFTLTHTRFSHISCIVWALLAVVVVAAQYLCNEHLGFVLF
ncbi:MAG: hypothetical protein IJP75_06705 [Bacteroidaceae bacterium]|nr:hypothetical protein [Bacteroidaceae bacterium]